jgi:hypothetical protein
MLFYGKEQLLEKHAYTGRDLQLSLLLYFTSETSKMKLVFSVASALIYELHKPALYGAMYNSEGRFSTFLCVTLYRKCNQPSNQFL